MPCPSRLSSEFLFVAGRPTEISSRAAASYPAAFLGRSEARMRQSSEAAIAAVIGPVAIPAPIPFSVEFSWKETLAEERKDVCHKNES